METAVVLVGLGKIVAGLALAVVTAYLVVAVFKRFGGLGDVQEKMRQRDPACAVACAAGMLAVGVILQQSLESTFLALDLVLRGSSSTSGAIGMFLLYAGVHVGIGLLAGLLVITVGMWLFNRLTPHVDEAAEVRGGNLAAAVLLGGVLVLVAWLSAPGLKTLLDGLLPWPPFPQGTFPR